MIHPSEITIGSLVTDEHYDTFKNIIKVESINDKGINLCIEDDGNWAEIAQKWIAPEYYTFDKIHGIPLTDDILIRCGFEKKVFFTPLFKTEIINYYGYGAIVYLIEDGFEVEKITKDGESVNLFTVFNHLHQLQNAVKLLCNQTIELK